MKKIISLFICLIIAISCPIVAFAVETEEDMIKSKSAILMCIDTGDVLYSKKEYEHLSPASVTKIMTILLALEAIENKTISLNDIVTASEYAVSKGGSQIWLEVGEQMTVEELLKAVVVASANDACTALSEFIGGSAQGFVKMMNDRAVELGLTNTNFENCTGLDDDTTNHYSCAYDLAVISCEVMKHSLLTNYTTIWLDSLRNGETELNNTNKLINTYNGITGLKTGTTSNAGFCISATAVRDGMNLVAVVLGSDTSENRFDTASYLLDYGYANYQLITPQIDYEMLKPVKVIGGHEKNITPKVCENYKICIEKGAGDLIYDYDLKSKINAPVSKGEKVGIINVRLNGEIVKTIDLIADKDISKVSIKDIFITILLKI